MRIYGCSIFGGNRKKVCGINQARQHFTVDLGIILMAPGANATKLIPKPGKHVLAIIARVALYDGDGPQKTQQY
jgi:hypothetical protein